MKRPTQCLTIVCLIWACNTISAQDRGWASSIAWSPDGQTIAVGSDSGIWFFDNDFNEVGHVDIKQQADSRKPRFVAWNASGDLLVYSGITIDSVKVVDVSKLEVIAEIDASRLWLWVPVVWHPTKNLIIGGTFGGEAHMWDAITGEERFFFDHRAEDPVLEWFEPVGFCWFTDDTVVIVLQDRGYVVNIVENRIVRKLYINLPPGPASCNRDYQIITKDGRLTDLQTGSSMRVFDYDKYAVAVEWSPDSSHFIVSSAHCRLRVFDGQTYEVVAELVGGGYWVRLEAVPIAWHPDGSRFAVVGEFGDVRVWDAKTYELMQRFDGFELHPNLLGRLEDQDLPTVRSCPQLKI